MYRRRRVEGKSCLNEPVRRRALLAVSGDVIVSRAVPARGPEVLVEVHVPQEDETAATTHAERFRAR